MNQINLRAYGKINLTLDIEGRRSDGYHLLESVMQSISLADEVSLKLQDQGISLHSNDPTVPVDFQNTCYRAVQAFQDYTGIKVGIRIELNKKIPAQAGLGGGSANAAAVLHGLNKLYNVDLTLPELQKLGLKVGADIPFCLQGGTALVQGVGEKVQPLKPIPQVSLVLVKPAMGISTQLVYATLSKNAHGSKATSEFVHSLQKGTSPQTLFAKLANALESVTLDLVPEIQVWKTRFLNAGALNALMSGSGTTVFGIFTDPELATKFTKHWDQQGQIYQVFPVSQGVEQLNGGDL